MNFIAVWYSVTNNGLPSNNQFHSQGKIVKVNHRWESMFNAFAPVFSL
jgi:hypothetical protein